MLRNLYKSDLDQLLRIENSVHIAPWNNETFQACFQVGYYGWVVEIDTSIIGFVIVAMNRDECHILNLCVANPNQRQGWGNKLMAHALNYAKQQGVGIAYLEVRRSNSRAIKLYKKLNFHLIGERKDYYPVVNGYEDALIFARSLRDEWL